MINICITRIVHLCLLFSPSVLFIILIKYRVHGFSLPSHQKKKKNVYLHLKSWWFPCLSSFLYRLHNVKSIVPEKRGSSTSPKFIKSRLKSFYHLFNQQFQHDQTNLPCIDGSWSGHSRSWAKQIWCALYYPYQLCASLHIWPCMTFAISISKNMSNMLWDKPSLHAKI